MDPAILLIIVFIIAPLIERLLKAGKDAKLPPPQQPRAPLPRPQPPRSSAEHSEQESPRVVIARREEESAATMLPDDLWEILTGQQRAPEPPPTVPQPVEAHGAGERAAWEQIGAEEIVEDPPVPANRRSADLGLPNPADFTRPVPSRLPPRIVSMEALEFDDENRHAQFHDRLERTRKPAAGEGARKTATYRFSSVDDVRRAFVLKEILGPPKGLE